MENVPHPSVFIREELAARSWSVDDLAQKMPGDFGRNKLVCDLYFLVGPDRKNMRLGKDADAFARALDVSPAMLLNLEAAWLA